MNTLSVFHELLAAGPVDAPPHWAWVLPFITILGCIAVLPLIHKTHHWWEENSSKLLVSGIMGGIVLIYVFMNGATGALMHALIEYVQFIMLLGSLYYISGGILLKGDIEATPKVNCMFLAIGAGLASFVGTTGASMLLIRPLLKTNSERKHVVHTVVFFIFMVSNIGGLLTPLGDPPLFLGFLRGVEFAWTFSLWESWLFMNVALLFIYYVWDTKAYRSESAKDIARDETQIKRLSITGMVNAPLLLGVILAVAGSKWMDANLSEAMFMPDNLKEIHATIDVAELTALAKEHHAIVPEDGFVGGEEAGEFAAIRAQYKSHHSHLFNGSPWREILMLILAVLSAKITPRGLREENKFSYHPIFEVAALFIGIFITMIPALLMLKYYGAQAVADPETRKVFTPEFFFWGTGILSSFLDNAPTYVTFFELAGTVDGMGHTGTIIAEKYLVPISLGAVFMGAVTYIGNGPNFMVKAIAEESGVKMPSFFGYMKYSICVLVPLLVIVMFLFL